MESAWHTVELTDDEDEDDEDDVRLSIIIDGVGELLAVPPCILM